MTWNHAPQGVWFFSENKADLFPVTEKVIIE
jgi:hypothetical protein